MQTLLRMQHESVFCTLSTAANSRSLSESEHLKSFVPVGEEFPLRFPVEAVRCPWDVSHSNKWFNHLIIALLYFPRCFVISSSFAGLISPYFIVIFSTEVLFWFLFF